MAVFFRSTQAERLSTPAHLRVVLERDEGGLRIRIPKRRGPPLTASISLTRPEIAHAESPASVPIRAVA
jgi:hypothetical protein